MAELGELFYSAGIKIDEREYNKLTNLATVLGSIKGERTVMLKVDGGYVKEGLNKFKQRVDSFVKQTEESTKIRISVDATDFKVGKNIDEAKTKIAELTEMMQNLRNTVAPTINSLKINIDTSAIASAFGMVNDYAKATAEKAKDLKSALDIAFAATPTRLKGYANNQAALTAETQLTNYQKSLEKNLKSASTAIDQYVKGTGGIATKGVDNFKALTTDINKQLEPMIGKYESMVVAIRTLREEMLSRSGGKESATTKRMAEQAQEIEHVIKLLTDLSNLKGGSFAEKSRSLNNLLALDEYKNLFANGGTLQELNKFEKRLETAMFNLGGNVPKKVSDAFKGYTDSVKKMSGVENLANITVVVNGFEPATGSISALRAKINRYLNESLENNPIEISNITIKDKALLNLADQVRKTIADALRNIDASVNANVKYQTDNTSVPSTPPAPPAGNKSDKKNDTAVVTSSTNAATVTGLSKDEEDKIRQVAIKLKKADLDNLDNTGLESLKKSLLKVDKFKIAFEEFASTLPMFDSLSLREQLKAFRDRASRPTVEPQSANVDQETERLKKTQDEQRKQLKKLSDLTYEDFFKKNDEARNALTGWGMVSQKEREQYMAGLKEQLFNAKENFSKVDLGGINSLASVVVGALKDNINNALEKVVTVGSLKEGHHGLQELKAAELALYQYRKAMEIITGTTALYRGSDKPMGIPELREGMSTAGGGKVVGKGTATSDSILLHASNGEWVMNAAATKMFEPFLLAANQMGRGEVNIGHVVDTLRSMGLSNSTVNTITVGELFVSAQNVSVTGHVTGDRGGKAHKDKGNEIWRELGGPVSSNNSSQKNWTKKQRENKLADILSLKAETESLVKTRNQTYSMMEKESSQLVRDKLKTLVDDYDKQLQEKKQTLESKIQEYISRAGKSFKKDAGIDFNKLFNLKGPKAPAAPKTAPLDKFDSTKEKVLGKITSEVDKIESNPSLLQGNKALQNRLDLYKSLQVEVNALKKDEAGLARLNEINGRVTGMGASGGVISQVRQGAAKAIRDAQMAAAAADEVDRLKADFTNRINAVQRQNDIWGATEAGRRINATAITENKELLERMTDIKNRNDVEMMKLFMARPLSLKKDGTVDEMYLREWREVAGFKHTIGAINEKERLRIEAEEARRAKEEAANNTRFRGAVDKRSIDIISAQAELDNLKKKANNALAIFNKPATVTMGDGAAAHTTTVNATTSQQLVNNVLATLEQIEKGKLRDIPAALEQVKNQIKNDLQQSGKLFNQAYKDAREDAKQQSVGKQLNLRNGQESTRLQGLIDRVNATITTPDPQRAGTGKYLREVVTDAAEAITKLQAVQQELNRINQIADPTQRKQELAKFATDINKLLGDVTTAFSNAQNAAKSDALNQSNRAKAAGQFYKDLKDANDKIAKEYGKYQNALNLFNNPESFKRGRWNIVTDATDALNIISKIKAELDAISVKTGQDKINAINNAVNSGLFDTLRKDAGTAYSKARKDALDTAIGLDNIDKADAKKTADAQRALVAAQKAFNAQIGKLDSEIGNLMQRRGALIGAGRGYSIIESRIGELENIKATSIATVNPNDIASLEAETKALQDNLKARRELTAQRKEEQKNANKPTPPTPPVPPGSNPTKVNAELKKQESIAHRLNQQLKRLRADRDKGQEFGKETAEIDKVIKKYEQLLDVVRRFNNSGKLMRGMDATKFFRSLTTQTKVARDADAMVDKQTADWARATNAQKGFESQTLQTLKSVFSLDQQFSMLASNIQNAFSIYALQQFAHSIIQIGGELERQQLAMGSIFGDARKAESIYQDVADLSMKSPFDVQDLLKNTKQLSAFGVEYQDLYDWTKRLSDIAAAVGVDFSRIGYEFGQMISMDYLDARHLRMFSMSGIPLIQQLTEHYSQQQGREVGVEEVRKMISKREVGADVVKDILKDMTNEGGKFYNMQEVMAESLASKWRNLSNAQNLMYGELAKSGWGEFLKSIAEGLTAVTKQWDTLGRVVGYSTIAFTVAKAAQLVYNVVIKNTAKNIAAQTLATELLSAAQVKNKISSQALTKAQLRQLMVSDNLTKIQKTYLAVTQASTLADKQKLLTSLKLNSVGRSIAIGLSNVTRFGSGATAVLSRLGALIGVAVSSWGFWIAAIAAGAAAIAYFTRNTDKLGEELRKIDGESKNNAEQEVESMRELTHRATDHNTALEDRKAAQDKLMSQFGEYFKDIDLEASAYENLTENVEAATKAILRKAEATAAEDKVKKIVENRESELGFQDDWGNTGLGYKLMKSLRGSDNKNTAKFVIDKLRENADLTDKELKDAAEKRGYTSVGIVGNDVITEIRKVIKDANQRIKDAVETSGYKNVWNDEVKELSAFYDELVKNEKEFNKRTLLEVEKNEAIFALLSTPEDEQFKYTAKGNSYWGHGLGWNSQDPDIKRYKENAEKQRKLLSRDWAMAANEVVYDWNVDKTDMKHQFANRNGFEIGVSAFSSALAPKSDKEFIVWAADIAKKKKEVEDDLNKWKINPQGDEASLRSVATLEETMARIIEIERRLGINFEEYSKNGDKANKKEADNLNKRIDNLKRAYEEYKRLIDAYGKDKANEIWLTTDRYRTEFEGVTLRDFKDIKKAFRDIYKMIPQGKEFQEIRNKLDETIINIGIDIDKESVQQTLTKLNKIIEGEIKQWDYFRSLLESGVGTVDASKLSLGGIAERLGQSVKESLEKNLREVYAKTQGDIAAARAEADYAEQATKRQEEAQEQAKRESAIEMEQFAGLMLPTRALNHIMKVESGTADRVKANRKWRVDRSDKTGKKLVVGGYQTAYFEGTPEYNKYLGAAMRGETLPIEEAQALFASKIKGFLSAVDTIRKQVSSGGNSITEGMYSALLSAAYKNGAGKLSVTSKLSKAIIENPYDFEKIKPLWDELYTVQGGEKLEGEKLEETQRRADKDWVEYISTSATISGEEIVSLNSVVNEARKRAVEETQKASIDAIKLAATSDDKIKTALNALESFNPGDLASMGIIDLASYLQYIVKSYLTGIGKELDSEQVGGMMGLYKMTDTQLKENFKGTGEADFIKSLVEKWKSEQDRELQERQKLVQESVNNLNKVFTEQQAAFNKIVKTIEAIKVSDATPERKVELIEGEKARYEDAWDQMVMKADEKGIFGNAFALTKKEIETSAETLRNKAREAFENGTISAEEYGKRLNAIDAQEQKAIEHSRKDFFGLLPQGGILGSKEREVEKAQQELDTAIQEAQVEAIQEFHDETVAEFEKTINAIKNPPKEGDNNQTGGSGGNNDSNNNSNNTDSSKGINKEKRQQSADKVEKARKNKEEKQNNLNSWKSVDGIIKNFGDVTGIATDTIGKLGGEGTDLQKGFQLAGDAAGVAAGIMSGNYAQALQSFINIIVQLSGLTKEWLKSEEEAAKARAELWKDSYDTLSGIHSETNYNSYITLNKIAALNEMFLAQMESIGSDVSDLEKQQRKMNQGEFAVDFEKQLSENQAKIIEYQNKANDVNRQYANSWFTNAEIGLTGTNFITGTLDLIRGDWQNALSGGWWGAFGKWFGGAERKKEYYRKVTENIKNAQKALYSFLRVESDAEANRKLKAIQERGDATTSAYIAGYYELIEQRKEIGNSLAAQEANKGKDRDEAAIREYRKQLEEINKEILEYVHNFMEAVYDLNLYDWAEAIGDALMEAFKNGENAAEAFHDTVNGLLEDVWNKIAQHVVLDPMIAELEEAIFGKADENGVLRGGLISDNAMDDINGTMESVVSYLSNWRDENGEKITEWMEIWFDKGKELGLYDDQSGSSTSASIQGMTEETADILAAYINAMRADLSYQRSEVELIRLNTDAMLEHMLRGGNEFAGMARMNAAGSTSTSGLEEMLMKMDYASSLSSGILQDVNYLATIEVPAINANLESQLQEMRVQTDHLDAINAHTEAMMEFTEKISSHFDKITRGDEYVYMR